MSSVLFAARRCASPRLFLPLVRVTALLLLVQLALAGAAYLSPHVDRWVVAAIATGMALPVALLLIGVFLDFRLAGYRWPIAFIALTWVFQLCLVVHACSSSDACLSLVALTCATVLSLQTNPLAIWPASVLTTGT